MLEMHISRLCEELVIWNSGLVRFVELDDAYCSTSSIMPQKKNPDVAEVLRSRTGSVLGEFVSAVSIIKGLPLTYNRDLQDLNPHLFIGTENVSRDIRLLAGMLKTASFQKDRMREEAGKGYSTATGLADHLVREYGISFRQAHNFIGRAIRDGNLDLKTVNKAAMELAGINLSEMGLTDAEIEHVLDPEYSIAERKNPGGPAPDTISKALKNRIRLLKKEKKEYETILKRALQAEERLIKKAQEFVKT
jgi:argininosuccinate lyase